MKKCPHFLFGCICTLCSEGMHIPPAEVEIRLCRTELFRECRRYRDFFSKHAGVGPAEIKELPQGEYDRYPLDRKPI